MNRAVIAGVLALLYVLALGSTQLADLGIGLLIGALLAWRLAPAQRRTRRRARRPPSLARRVLMTPVFLWGGIAQIAKGTRTIVAVALGRRPWQQLGTVDVPIGQRSRLGIIVTIIAAQLSPGTLFVEFDRRRRSLRFNVIDASDPDAVRAEFHHFYDRYQRHVFP